MTEITIIHESAIGADDATEYRAVLMFADEIERRRGCINYGAVSRIAMELHTFRSFMADGKFAVKVEVLDATTARIREYDSMPDPEDAVIIRADATSGLFDLSPLGWEFFPAERFI